MNTNTSRSFKIIFIGIIGVLIFILSAFLLWGILRFTLIIKIFDYVVYNIVNVSGMSYLFAKGIFIFLLIPFVLALGELFKIRFRLNLFRTKPIRSYRNIALVVIIAYIGFFFLSMYFFSRGTYFGHTTGETLKWYAETPEGIRFFDSPGFDPKYGIKLEPVTPDMMIKYHKKAMGILPKRVNMDFVEILEFFDPVSGDPKIWYFISEEGKYELFDGPGFHPVFRKELKPITPEIMSILLRKAKEESERIAMEEKKKIEAEKAKEFMAYLNRYVNLSVVNKEDTKEIAIMIIEEGLKERLDIAQSISSYLKSQGLNPLLSLFRSPFISEGLFDEIFSGDTRKVKDLQIINHADYILLGRKLTNFRTAPELENLISAELNLELKIISADTGVIVRSQRFTAIGAGFSNSTAEEKALETIGSKIEKFLYGTF